mmetsp:Transcript_7519/g.18089  ORF Transcript_7519/g.18089 Transcript_7519/m.18089 type:complete len:421 (-) Transcript_7519:2093-3355(-)
MLSDPQAVRPWLLKNHPRQLALLDKFEVELKLGRLSAVSSEHRAKDESLESIDRRTVAFRTVEILKTMIGSTRWQTPAQLVALLRGLGRELHSAGGFREPAIGNVVRRIIAAVREEVMNGPPLDEADGNAGTRNRSRNDRSLESILWALPQQFKSNRSAVIQQPQRTQRTDSINEFVEASDLPSPFFQTRPDLKQAVMEAIIEFTSDLEDLHKNINDQATDHIHAGEIVLTYGRSKTVESFLKAAADKRLKFTVVVCESAPKYEGSEMAKSLADYGIDTCLIPDSAMFCMMARVNKVLLPAHAVLANGGLIAPSGCNMVVLSASQNSVPVICLTGMFKLTPLFPHEGQDTLNDLLCPSSVVSMHDKKLTLNNVDLVNPIYDYVRPELINLYVTNVGSFQPSYIYRLLAEYYHNDDWNSFE